MTMTVEEAMEIVNRPRTQYEGRQPTVAEVLAAEVARLRARVAELEAALAFADPLASAKDAVILKANALAIESDRYDDSDSIYAIGAALHDLVVAVGALAAARRGEKGT